MSDQSSEKLGNAQNGWSELQSLQKKKEVLKVGGWAGGSHEPGGSNRGFQVKEERKPCEVNKATRHVISLGLVHASAKLT